MKLDDIKKLHQKKYREEFGYFLVEGEHLILELQRTYGKFLPKGEDDIQILVTEKYANWQSPFSKKLVTDKQMARLSDTKTPQGILACVPFPQNRGSTKQTLSINPEVRYLYLYEIQDPGNLGTILRTLAWFGGFHLLLSPNSVDPYNSKVIRASMGAIFHVEIELDVSLETLNCLFPKFAFLDVSGKSIKTEEFSNYPCYIFGNEARGIPKSGINESKTTAFTIQGSGAIDSLNLASAVNMCLFQLSQ